ncbi:MAG: hypothetical protein AB1567_08590 [bacterium]
MGQAAPLIAALTSEKGLTLLGTGLTAIQKSQELKQERELAEKKLREESALRLLEMDKIRTPSLEQFYPYLSSRQTQFPSLASLLLGR